MHPCAIRAPLHVFGLIEAAKKELAQPAPEQFKVFLLAVMAGLRRREIDTLPQVQNGVDKTPRTEGIDNWALHKLLAEYVANKEKETQS